MRWIRTLTQKDTELQDLMRSTARNLVFTVAGLYLTWHMIATLGYPQTFSPSLWNISIYMLALVIITLRLGQHHYVLSQVIWLVGLVGAILLGFFIYQWPDILLLVICLPLVAVVTIGIPGTAFSVVGITIVIAILDNIYGLPLGFTVAIFLSSTFVAIFGWGVSSNLLNALDAASYHYGEARRLLEETRNHRAEISRMLKDRNQVNYQLERMNEMLTFARAQAEDARENRNRFMLAVSHELRSPLNFIIGFSDLMVNAPETYAPAKEWPSGLYDDVQEIYTSSRHLMRLINDILDMGKIDARQMSLYREKAQMDQIVTDVRDMLVGAFAQKNISLVIDIPPDLPPVFVDTTRMRQVLINLLNNGLRFTDQGSVTLSIQKLEDQLLVSVTDTGTGIAHEDLPKVFEEFRQVGDENWRRRAGTGLGLYISRHFVELHGGNMDVESTPGQGTRFYFTLPLDSSRVQGREQSEQSQPIQRDNSLVLVVTQRPEDTTMLQHALDGYTLQQVQEVGQVVELTARLYPRAVFVASDSGSLPVENLPYDVPVVHFSLPRPGKLGNRLHAQLVKPISRKVLLDTLISLGPKVRRVLVVDDDPAMIRFVQQSLRADKDGRTAEGYDLISAFNGEQALELLLANPVDAILLDLELPDVNGWEWLTNLENQKILTDIPIIIISAQDLPEMNLLPGASALQVTLRRPLKMAELSSMAKSVLENILPQYPQEK
ncbi:MAG TPA: ATP-binding protein [Anaerolineales bacterium]|jgi:signal transduction histidine kinase/CheY-like chemotaxis protein